MREIFRDRLLLLLFIAVLITGCGLAYEIATDSFSIYGKPEVVYPSDLDKKGSEYDHYNVSVGFWKLPGSLVGFGEKNGGKLIRLTESDIKYQSVVYETNNQTDFIARASRDPRVRYIYPVYIGHIGFMNVTVGLPNNYTQTINKLSTCSTG